MVYPNENFVLARYLSLSFDIGPAINAKKLTKKGTYIHRLTLRKLTDADLACPLEMNERQ